MGGSCWCCKTLMENMDWCRADWGVMFTRDEEGEEGRDSFSESLLELPSLLSNRSFIRWTKRLFFPRIVFLTKEVPSEDFLRTPWFSLLLSPSLLFSRLTFMPTTESSGLRINPVSDPLIRALPLLLLLSKRDLGLISDSPGFTEEEEDELLASCLNWLAWLVAHSWLQNLPARTNEVTFPILPQLRHFLWSMFGRLCPEAVSLMTGVEGLADFFPESFWVLVILWISCASASSIISREPNSSTLNFKSDPGRDPTPSVQTMIWVGSKATSISSCFAGESIESFFGNDSSHERFVCPFSWTSLHSSVLTWLLSLMIPVFPSVAWEGPTVKVGRGVDPGEEGRLQDPSPVDSFPPEDMFMGVDDDEDGLWWRRGGGGRRDEDGCCDCRMTDLFAVGLQSLEGNKGLFPISVDEWK